MKDELEAFVLAEARLLDERRFSDWLALFAEDGVYWVPTNPRQASPQEAASGLWRFDISCGRLDRSRRA